jgi:murein peptide amidase A
MTPDQVSTSIQRLGRNKGRYLGETIELQALQHEIRLLALKFGWQNDCFLNTDQYDLHAYHQLFKPTRTAIQIPKRLYISAGMHGDEPAGPRAVLELMMENEWPEGIEVWLCPCLNPTGLASNQRENAQGLDLNRQYLSLRAEETRAHVAWLEQQPAFDFTLCLHEDWEAHGFYVYELNPDNRPSLAEEIVRRVAHVCPIDPSPLIEGRDARQGIIRPSSAPFSRFDWPEAFYLIHHKTRLSYTLEAPSDFPLTTRIGALVTGVRAVLDACGANRSGNGPS